MIKFAVFTDLHYDFIPDGQERLNTFLYEIKDKNLDFIMNLGDFCLPIPENKHVLNHLESLRVPCYHALGNHDSDTFEKSQVFDFLNLNNSYYTFTYSNTKFIVLDACFTEVNGVYTAYNRKNFKSSNGKYPIIPPEQLEWLKHELNDTYSHYVLFSHHSLENDFANRGIHNRLEVQEILSEVTEQGKRITCFNGHDHADSNVKIDDTHYIGINGMSYIWFGDFCTLRPYSLDMYKMYPLLKDIVLYDKGLYAVVTIDNNEGLVIDGMTSGYRNISPDDLGLNDSWNGRKLSSVISSVQIK
ncbi:MAG: metallophosphoesterase [Clostridiales bacterium]|nr:metallophosphoesterase [Clostridiales bacterium]